MPDPAPDDHDLAEQPADTPVEPPARPDVIVLTSAPVANPHAPVDPALATAAQVAAPPSIPLDADLDAYTAAIREEITRHGGTLTAAVGIVVGAASVCWTNLPGAGVYRSDRVVALIQILAEHIADQ